MDGRVIVETSGERFPIVTVPGMSPANQQAGDLTLIFHQGRQQAQRRCGTVRCSDGLGATALPRNFGFDQISELCERLLPAEVAHLDWNDFRNPFLHNSYLGAARDRLQ